MMTSLSFTKDTMRAVAARYSIAVAATGLAVWGRFALAPWLNSECPFSFFYLSVLVTAWIAGIGPARLAIALGTFAAANFFLQANSGVWLDDFADVLQLSIYVFVNCVATSLLARIERARKDAEARSAENQLLTQSLQESDVRKDEFLALLAHELRNPLAPVRSSLILLDRARSIGEAKETLPVLQRNTEHLIRLTNDLLDASRFCRGKVNLLCERVDLRSPVDAAVEMMMPMFDEKGVRFHMLLPDSPIFVDCDSVRVTQLIGNLLSNACKYTPIGGRVALQLESRNDGVQIVVSDNGVGLAKADLGRIMEPFVQLDLSRTREQGGLGLGLTIVCRIAKLHGWELAVSSDGLGRGSRFNVAVPANMVFDPPEYVDSATEATVAAFDGETVVDLQLPPAATAHCAKVLIVDDNVDAADIMGQLLEMEGYEIALAHDGLAGVEAARRYRPDVIVLDIGLPGIDGFEVARKLRSDLVRFHGGLIALTGWGEDASRAEAVSSGFDAYLVKPADFPVVLEQIERLLNSERQPAPTRPVATT